MPRGEELTRRGGGYKKSSKDDVGGGLFQETAVSIIKSGKRRGCATTSLEGMITYSGQVDKTARRLERIFNTSFTCREERAAKGKRLKKNATGGSSKGRQGSVILVLY